jgi:hypothetical protein
MSVLAPAQEAWVMPRPCVGDKVLFNAGNSAFWHPAEVTMVPENDESLELTVTMVHGRTADDWGASAATLEVKSVCYHESDPRIRNNSETWQTIIADDVGGKWKFRDTEACYVTDIAELKRENAQLQKRLAKVDKFLLELGHVDTLGNQPGPDPKPSKPKAPKTPLADADNTEN